MKENVLHYFLFVPRFLAFALRVNVLQQLLRGRQQPVRPI